MVLYEDSCTSVRGLSPHPPHTPHTHTHTTTTTTSSPAPPPSAWLGGHGGPTREEPGSERTWLDTMVAKKPGEARESPVGCGQRARKEPGNVPKSPISRASYICYRSVTRLRRTGIKSGKWPDPPLSHHYMALSFAASFTHRD